MYIAMSSNPFRQIITARNEVGARSYFQKRVSRILSTGVGGGACMAGGHAWQGGMHGGGHVWQGACMVGGMHGRGDVW